MVLSHTLKKSNTVAKGEYPVWNDIYNGRINAGIVIYGSSRAWIQIDPELIAGAFHTRTYNLGVDGHNIVLAYLRHRLLLKYDTPPKVIIYSLDRNTLGALSDLYNPDQLLPYMLFNMTIRNATAGMNGFNLSDYLIPSLRFMGRRSTIDKAFEMLRKHGADKAYRVNGYRSRDEAWNNDFEMAQKQMPAYVARLDPGSIHLFEKYLNECKEKNIKNIFVYTPEYIDGQHFVKNRAEIMQAFTSFARKYDIPFYDYSNDPISFNKKYFYNSEHLNTAGSELFTKEFVADLVRDGFISKALQK